MIRAEIIHRHLQLVSEGYTELDQNKKPVSTATCTLFILYLQVDITQVTKYVQTPFMQTRGPHTTGRNQGQ